MKEHGGVYCIKNIVSWKIYIWQSVNLLDRYRAHRNNLNKWKHLIKEFQEDWDSFWEEVFEFDILYISDGRDATAYETRAELERLCIMWEDKQNLYNREHVWDNIYIDTNTHRKIVKYLDKVKEFLTTLPIA